jgi:predicted ester cyclase
MGSYRSRCNEGAIAVSPDELRVRARRFAEELLTQGDLAIAAEIFTHNCQHHAPEPVASGDVGIAAWVAGQRRAFPDLRAIVEDEIAEGDSVALRLSLEGTQEGALGDIPASGRHAAWHVFAILHAGPEGSFIEMWSSWDQLGLLLQLGSGSHTREEQA